MNLFCRCEWCKQPLPNGCKSNRQYCDHQCRDSHYWQKNRAKRLVQKQTWRRNNKPHTRQYSKNYYSGTFGKQLKKAQNARYRPTLCKNPRTPATADQLLQKLQYWDFKCAYCGADVKGTDHGDHVTPVSRGGDHHIGNRLPACAACNKSKNDQLLPEWNEKRYIELLHLGVLNEISKEVIN